MLALGSGPKSRCLFKDEFGDPSEDMACRD